MPCRSVKTGDVSVGLSVAVLLTLLIAYCQYLPFALEQLDAGRSLNYEVIAE